jgi:hypothetical protein
MLHGRGPTQGSAGTDAAGTGDSGPERYDPLYALSRGMHEDGAVPAKVERFDYWILSTGIFYAIIFN